MERTCGDHKVRVQLLRVLFELHELLQPTLDVLRVQAFRKLHVERLVHNIVCSCFPEFLLNMVPCVLYEREFLDQAVLQRTEANHLPKIMPTKMIF